MTIEYEDRTKIPPPIVEDWTKEPPLKGPRIPGMKDPEIRRLPKPRPEVDRRPRVHIEESDPNAGNDKTSEPKPPSEPTRGPEIIKL